MKLTNLYKGLLATSALCLCVEANASDAYFFQTVGGIAAYQNTTPAGTQEFFDDISNGRTLDEVNAILVEDIDTLSDWIDNGTANTVPVALQSVKDEIGVNGIFPPAVNGTSLLEDATLANARIGNSPNLTDSTLAVKTVLGVNLVFPPAVNGTSLLEDATELRDEGTGTAAQFNTNNAAFLPAVQIAPLDPVADNNINDVAAANIEVMINALQHMTDALILVRPAAWPTLANNAVFLFPYDGTQTLADVVAYLANNAPFNT